MWLLLQQQQQRNPRKLINRQAIINHLRLPFLILAHFHLNQAFDCVVTLLKTFFFLFPLNPDCQTDTCQRLKLCQN